MAISSSSIFHFTKAKSALEGMLTDGFKVKYCLETVRAEFKDNCYAVPMVSFCDIPLSQVKDHINKYGPYGIGLTKEWARKQRLSPVQYVAAGSFHGSSLKLVINSMIPKDKSKWTDLSDSQRAVIDLMRYLKNYEGDLKRGAKPISNYRYYDEREWRYVPEFSDEFPMLVRGENYQTASQKSAANAHLSEIRLKFEPSDIKYIIVKSEGEVHAFVDVIRQAKGKNFPMKDIELLTTRILTKEQIESDL
jgi:hypothetical protein